MTTVFVLMQPLSGMVFAKSFYRVLGTAAGLVAALALGGLFAQQPELYMAGITPGSAPASRSRCATATSAGTASCSPATRPR